MALLPPDADAIRHAKEHQDDVPKDPIGTGKLGEKECQDMEAARLEMDKLKNRLLTIATELGYEDAVGAQ